MVLAAGDAARHRQTLMQITVAGELAPGRAVLRSGARAGGLICVSGRLGEAQLGLELILRGWDRGRRGRRLLRKHLHPEPRLAQEPPPAPPAIRSEEHTSELQSHLNLVCRLLLEKKKSNAECISNKHRPPRLRYFG